MANKLRTSRQTQKYLPLLITVTEVNGMPHLPNLLYSTNSSEPPISDTLVLASWHWNG